MRTVCTVLACVLMVGTAGSAQPKPDATARPQEKPPVASAAPSEQPKPLVPLKVQIVLSRFKGEKKIGSLPYVLGVTANEEVFTNLRMGIDVPVGRKGDPAIGISYRSVGTNIDCQARSVSGDYFKLAVRVEDTSVLAEAADNSASKAAEPTVILGDMPAFRSFKSNFTVLLRDGQTSQHTSAVDPISGEVMKIDVTLNVMK